MTDQSTPLRLVLDEQAFRELVAGRVARLMEGTNMPVHLILSNIGYKAMITAVIDAIVAAGGIDPGEDRVRPSRKRGGGADIKNRPGFDSRPASRGGKPLAPRRRLPAHLR